MLTRLVNIIFVASVVFRCVDCSNIQIRNNGYENVVVAINEDIPESPELIEEIKSMFRDASAFLHIATRRRAYIRNVTILLPGTWKDDANYSPIGRERFETANIRIDRMNPLHGDGPYTRQVQGCEKPGQYIHLTPEFVLDSTGVDRTETWGPIGKVLVHEFAHLRYGVFDEYENGRSPGDTAQGCSAETVLKCEESTDDTQQTECPTESSRPKASIMYKQFLPGIDSFCESETQDPFLKHNSNLDNDQNNICSNRGTWDVISSHADFANGNNPAVGIADTSPMFTTVYPRVTMTPNGTAICRRQVLIMDISGSMGGSRIYKLGQIASKLIKDFSPIGTELGMVVFSSSARVWEPMTVLQDDSVKNDTTRLLPDQDSIVGFTGIGSGVLKGIELLQGDGKSSDGAVMFLISDGGENVAPMIKDIVDNVTASGVKVYTVALSPAAASDLTVLSETSGGKYYFVKHESEASFDGVLASLAEELQCQTGRRPTVELTRRTVTLTDEMTSAVDTVLVDPSVGNQTLFSFSYPEGLEIEVTLFGPSVQYDKTSPEYSRDDQFNIIRFKIPNAKAGTWTYNISNVGNLFGDKVLVVTAISYPKQGVDPITVKAYISKIEISFGNRAAIYAEVLKGYLPVVRADVMATVDRETGGPVDVELFDNGQGADIRKDDGVYSAYFTEYTDDGKYSIDVVVSSNDETSVVTAGPGAGGAAQSTKGPPPPTVLEKVEPFRRITSGGGFLVSDFDPNLDPYPPSRITDLRAEEYDYTRATVTLTWTAPGGDLDQGNASHYELRRGDTFDELRLNFNESFQINISFVVPLPAKSLERIVIQLPKNISSLEQHIFAIRAFDDALNEGEVSNLVFVEKTEPTTKSSDTVTKRSVNSGMNLTKIMVGLIAIAVVLALAVEYCR